MIPTSLRTERLTKRNIATLCAALALSGTLAFNPVAANAQESTPAPLATPQAATPTVQEQASVNALMAFDFTELPAAPATVRLLRITLQPGASVPLHTHPGPEFDKVESGVLTVEAAGTANVFRGTSTTPESLTDSTSELVVDDWILYPSGSGMSLTNNGEETVELLSAVILPVGADAPASITYTDGNPSAGAFDGVSFKVLGDGLISQLPTGASRVTVDEVLLPAGTDLPASQGPALYSRVEGNLSFSVRSGDVQVSRTANEGLQPNAIPDQQFTLETGDAAFFPAGVDAMSRADETGSLSFYRLSIQPSSSLEAAPALIESIASPAPAPSTNTAAAATPASTPTSGWAIGSTVRTTESGVNLRAEPSVDGDVVNELNAGIELELIGGPEEGDDFTWYQVQLTGDAQGDWSSGWIASQFLESDAATPTPSPTVGTPSANGTPAAASFEQGDIVAVTEDGVRIRVEPSTDSDAFDTLSTDLNLRIIGGPENANDLTFYQVEIVGDEETTGWVAASFLQKAPATAE